MRPLNNSIKRIAIGSDHIGSPLKEEIRKYLNELGYEVQDFGTNTEQRTDYPLFAKEVTSAVVSDQADAGILICGSGVGMAITANKVKGIRAVVCSEPYSAILSRQHNNTNVLTFGSRVVGLELAKMIVKGWLEAEYEGGRHGKRLEMISQIEAGRAEQNALYQDEQLSKTRSKIAEVGEVTAAPSCAAVKSAGTGRASSWSKSKSGSRRRWVWK